MSHMNMLLINDKSYTASLDAAGYRRLGVKVFVAGSTKEIASILATNNIHLTLINFDYPRLSARRILAFLKKEGYLRKMPIVLTSVCEPSVVINKMKGFKIDLIAQLPIPRTTLFEKMKLILKKKARNEERIDSNILEGVRVRLGNRNFLVKVEDISKTGMKIFTKRTLKLDDQIILEFKIPKFRSIATVNAEVIRVDNNKNIYGIRYTSFSEKVGIALLSFVEELKNKHSPLKYYF